MRRLVMTCAIFFVAGLGMLSSARAHPHVWITVRSEAQFNLEGQLVAIRHHWTFDDIYSSFIISNLGSVGAIIAEADLLPLAKESVEALAEYDYFTFSQVSGKPIAFIKPQEYSMTYEAKQQVATLHFTLPLAAPIAALPAFSFAVFDPTYYVAFTFDKGEAAQIMGAPSGCGISLDRPSQLSAKDQEALSRAASENLSPGEDLAFKLADRAIITCR